MSAKSVITYVAVFVAGSLAVVGGFWLGGGFTDRTQQAAAPQSSLSNQQESSASEAATSAEDSPAAAPEGPAEQVTRIADLQRNTFVTVVGEVAEIRDEDEFVLSDASGEIEIWTSGALFTTSPGESVTVRGFVDDDLFLEIYAQEIERADGSVVTISPTE